jgi:membrane-bound inhibitor of C-type lysozyme
VRTYSIEKVKKATSQYAEEIVGLDVVEWLSNPYNVALTNSNDDIAMFERVHAAPSTVYGHYFFWSRGKDARNAAKQFLKEIFTGNYNVQVILGLTPLEHKGALWLNRQLGFKEIGQTDSVVGELRMVMLTKKEWEQQ